MQIDSTNVDVYYTRAKVLSSALNFKEALPVYSKAISIAALIAEIFNDRAYVRYRLKDYNEALKDCNKALNLYPGFMSAYYNKGVINLEMGRPKLALKNFDTSLFIPKTLPGVIFIEVLQKKQLNDMKGACNDWGEAVKLGLTLAPGI